jgi:hypothetical protein
MLQIDILTILNVVITHTAFTYCLKAFTMSWDRLRQRIDAYFSLEEIKTLCFDLGIDYESIGGEGKSGKIREIISLCRRTHRVPELISYLANLRPHGKWGELTFEADPISIVPPAQSVPATQQETAPIVTPPPPAQQSQQPDQAQPPAAEVAAGKSQANTVWRNWGDHPLVVVFVVIGTIIGIIVGIQQILGQGNPSTAPTIGNTNAALTSEPTVTSTEPTITLASTVAPPLDAGSVSNTAAVQTATAIFVVEGTRAATTATAAIQPTSAVAQPTIPPSAVGGGTGRIAFVSDREGVSTIYTVDVGSGQSQRLVSDWLMEARRPAWSPDGSKIAFNVRSEAGYDIYTSDADGSGVTNITNSPQIDYSRATWSPDSTRLAYGTTCGVNNNEICVLRIGENRPVNITNSAGQDYDPSWSPTSNQIAFVSDRDGTTSIYVMFDDGSRLRHLAAGTSPAWSPDGRKIAFTAMRGDNYDIFVIDADGSNEVQLTSNPARDAAPSWSPDGTKIAFISTRDELNGGVACNDDKNVTCKYTVYYMDADGGNTTRVTNSEENSRAPVWQPALR